MMSQQAKRYRAFISYSQKDKEHARRLHRALEAYRIPSGIEATDVDAKSRKLGRFFRDDEEMGAATDLGAALQGAIADAENLIVACSPNAAQSKWVNEEIIHFKRTGRADNIFAVIVAGVPHSADERECFPPALRFTLGNDGALTDQRAEPLAIDLRKESFARVLARLVAGLIRTPFDVLWRREQRQARLRARRTALVAASAAMVTVAIGTGAAREAHFTFANGVLAAAEIPSLSDAQRVRLAVLAARASLLAPAPQEAVERLNAIITSVSSEVWRDSPSFTLQHASQVRSVALSFDGTRIVTGSDDGAARVWDAANGREIAVLRGHEWWVLGAAFSRDGRRIVTVSGDSARVWDAANGRELAVLRGHEGHLTGAAFSPDGHLIVTTSSGNDYTRTSGTARVWDSATGRQFAVLEVVGQTGSPDFSSDGRRIVVVCDDSTARVFDAVTGRQIAVLRGHERGVHAAAFSPDGARVITAPLDDETARVWDAATGRQIAVLRGHEGAVRSAAFSPDGSRIITASADSTARVWDAASGREIAVLDRDTTTPPAAFFDRNRIRIVTVGNVVYEARVWESTRRGSTLLRSHTIFYAFSPDGARIVTESGEYGAAWVWDAANGREIAVLRGHGSMVYAAAFSPDGRRIVTVSQDSARVWDAANGREITVLRGHERGVNSAAFSPDGSRIITASADSTARVWDAASGREIAIVRGNDGELRSAAFSPDSTRIVTVSKDNVAVVWDAATGRELAVLQAREGIVRIAAVSPDGSRIATVYNDDHIARVWDAATGREVAVLRGHEWAVLGAAFSRDGMRIVTIGGDQTVRIWDAASGREVAVLRHEFGVDSAALNVDGSLVVTTYGGTARVWDVASGSEIASLRGDDVAFSPDGASIVARPFSFLVQVWDASPMLNSGWRQRTGLPYLAELECAENGALSGSARFITEADAQAAPLLRRHVGRDVCATPLAWESLLRQLLDGIGLRSNRIPR
jgi:WD40 repeat protein